MKSGKIMSPSQSKYDPAGPEEPASSDQAFDSIHTDASFSEELGATYRLSDMDTTKNAILQHSEISDAENADTTLIPAKELNTQFSDLGQPFTEPKSMAVANIIAERQRKRQALAETIANGPQGNFYGIARFATAMIPHAIDPVNVGTSLAVGALTEGLGVFPKAAQVVGEGAIAAEGIEAATAAVNVARSGIVKSALQSEFTKHVAEGIVGNAVGETMVARSALQEGREYNAEDAFLNTVGGALMIPGAVLGFQKLSQGMRYTGKMALNRSAEYLNRIDPKYSETMLKTSEARLLQDKPLGVEVYGEHAMAELNGKSPEWAGPLDYKYEKLGEQVPPEKKFYAATYDHAESIHTGRTEPFDQFLGDAVYATDNPTVANGAAARGFKDGNGRIIEISPNSDMRLLDLSQPIPENLKETFAAHDIKMPDGTPLMDALHKMQDEIQSNTRDPWALDKLNKDLIAAGYDGYISDGAKVEGMTRDPHNSVSIFNKEKIKETGEIHPEADKVGTLEQTKLDQIRKESAEETSHAISNPDESIKEFQRVERTEVKPPELSELERQETDLSDKARRMDEQGMLDSSDQKVLEDVTEAKKEAGLLKKLMDYASDCVGYH